MNRTPMKPAEISLSTKGICLNWIILMMLFYCPFLLSAVEKKPKIDIWNRFEITLNSPVSYTNPVYDVAIEGIFTSPSGKQYKAEGFWDGGNSWKIRFMPNEKGTWHFQTRCTDLTNGALHHQTGQFTCKRNRSPLAIYRHGKITHQKGNYHLTHADGTPFFYLGCTAWNGAMRSTDEEWKTYLDHRKENHYTAIQFITTQWRGLPAEALEEPAFTGIDTLTIHPAFFQALDRKIEQINQAGLIAAPVMLWAWKGAGNPGIDLPIPSAIQLAKYIKARYDAYHVLWNLGGDGIFTDGNAAKWKQIGRAVFGETDAQQRIVTLHTAGFQWYANEYDGETWLDLISYQTGHANSESAVRWKTRGPVTANWRSLIPRPIIDTEPVYEAQGEQENDYEVRKSILWSIFSAPVAGVGYGAWSTWPWLRVGETSYNHGMKKPSKYTWEDGIRSKASIQVGRLPLFFNQFKWWELRPAPERLKKRNDEKNVFNTAMALADTDARTVLVYVPTVQPLRISHTLPATLKTAQWYYPATGTYKTASVTHGPNYIEATSDSDTDAILMLRFRTK